MNTQPYTLITNHPGALIVARLQHDEHGCGSTLIIKRNNETIFQLTAPKEDLRYLGSILVKETT